MCPISLWVFLLKHLQSGPSVGICCLAGSRTATSRKMVALGSSWFQSLLQRRFPSLICGSRMSSCVLLRLRLCLSAYKFWLEQPACGTENQVVSGSSQSGKEILMFFGVPGAPGLLSSPSARYALFLWHQQWLIVQHF